MNIFVSSSLIRQKSEIGVYAVLNIAANTVCFYMFSKLPLKSISQNAVLVLFLKICPQKKGLICYVQI